MVYVAQQQQRDPPTSEAATGERAAAPRAPSRATAPITVPSRTQATGSPARARSLATASPVRARSGPLKQAGWALPPPNHPEWTAVVPRPAAGSLWTPVRRPKTPPSVQPSPSSSPSASQNQSSPAGSPDEPPLLPRVQTPPRTPPPSPPASVLSSPESEIAVLRRPTWHKELRDVLNLPVNDWRHATTEFGVAGVDMHISPECLEEVQDDDSVGGAGEKINPTDLVSPRFIAGRPLDLEALAKFSAIRTEHGMALTYEEHAAIRAADAAALFKCQSPNIRDAGGLHRFFLSTRAARALVYDWRSTDAMSAITLNDRLTDSITIMLSVRPDFEGPTLDGNMLDISAHIAESLLDSNGLPLPRYAAAVDEIVTVFRHRVAVPHVRDFVRRLQLSGRIDFPRLARPGLSSDATAHLRGERLQTSSAGVSGTPALPRPAAPELCNACTAQGKLSKAAAPTGSTGGASPCVCQTKRRAIARLPGTLTVQHWRPEDKNAIVQALNANKDSIDAMYAGLRSLHVCGGHAIRILDAVLDDLKLDIPLSL